MGQCTNVISASNFVHNEAAMGIGERLIVVIRGHGLIGYKIWKMVVRVVELTGEFLTLTYLALISEAGTRLDFIKPTEYEDRLIQKIEQSSIQSKGDYQELSIICCRLQMNAPFVVIEGFLRRIWVKLLLTSSWRTMGPMLCGFTMNWIVIMSSSRMCIIWINIPWFLGDDAEEMEVDSVPSWVQFSWLHYKFRRLEGLS